MKDNNTCLIENMADGTSKVPKNDYFEPGTTTANNNFQRKRSLGTLRQNEKTKPRSPDATGKLYFQRHTLTEIYRQLADSGDDEVICNLAGWRNSDQHGSYLTVEISPL
jgi:hypothetical protein